MINEIKKVKLEDFPKELTDFEMESFMIMLEEQEAIMERKKAERIASTQLNHFEDQYLNRTSLANVFGVEYQTVPKLLEKKGYTFPKGERMRLHKEVVKELLIEQHMGS